MASLGEDGARKGPATNKVPPFYKSEVGASNLILRMCCGDVGPHGQLHKTMQQLLPSPFPLGKQLSLDVKSCDLKTLRIELSNPLKS